MNQLRRRLLLLAAVSSLAASAIAEAQDRIRVVGYWGVWAAPGRPPPTPSSRIDWFEEGLAKHGFIAGKNLRIVYAFTGHDFADSVLQQARELLAEKPEVIFIRTPGIPGRFAAIRALNQAIPLTFHSASEQTAEEWVGGNVRRPAGNITGVALKYSEYTDKRLELVRFLLPKARRVAVVGSQGEGPFMDRIAATGKRLGFEVIAFGVSARHGPDASAAERVAALFATLDQVLDSRPDAFITVGSAPESGPGFRSMLGEFELRHRLPFISEDGGGVISYGVDMADHRRRLVGMIVEILGGKKPADIPVDVTSRFVLKVNLKRAKQIGLHIPPKVLVGADEIIQ